MPPSAVVSPKESDARFLALRQDTVHDFEQTIKNIFDTSVPPHSFLQPWDLNNEEMRLALYRALAYHIDKDEHFVKTLINGIENQAPTIEGWPSFVLELYILKPDEIPNGQENRAFDEEAENYAADNEEEEVGDEQ